MSPLTQLIFKDCTNIQLLMSSGGSSGSSDKKNEGVNDEPLINLLDEFNK
jgi:hypothetical protein